MLVKKWNEWNMLLCVNIPEHEHIIVIVCQYLWTSTHVCHRMSTILNIVYIYNYEHISSGFIVILNLISCIVWTELYRPAPQWQSDHTERAPRVPPVHTCSTEQQWIYCSYLPSFDRSDSHRYVLPTPVGVASVRIRICLEIVKQRVLAVVSYFLRLMQSLSSSKIVAAVAVISARYVGRGHPLLCLSTPKF